MTRAALLALLALHAGRTITVRPAHMTIRSANVAVTCKQCVVQHAAVFAPAGQMTVQRVQRFAAVGKDY